MQISVEREHEDQGGWRFELRLEGAQGKATVVELHLSWADYDHWCRGAAPPASVARAVGQYLAARETIEQLPARIDASTVRRRYPQIDAEIRTLIDVE